MLYLKESLETLRKAKSICSEAKADVENILSVLVNGVPSIPTIGVGDIVIVPPDLDVGINDAKRVQGMTGRVVGDDMYDLACEFPDYKDGHDCGGRAIHPHGWNVRREFLRVVRKALRKP